MSTVESKTGNHLSFNPEQATLEISRMKQRRNRGLLAAAKAERETLTNQLNKVLVDFSELEEIHGHLPTSEGSVSLPAEFPGHRKFYDSYWGTELVCYLVSLLLLAAQTWLTLSFDWSVKLAIVVGGFLLVLKLFPAIIWTAFDVDQRQKDSVKPVKITFLFAAALGLAGLVAFAITRSSAEGTGTWVVVYNNALVAAELGFAICGACAHVMRKFFSWSIVHAQVYTKLEQRINEVSGRITELTQAQPDKLTMEEDGNDDEIH